MKGKTVFFDLDGTLTDPRQGIVRSIRYALEEMDRPVPETDDLLWCIGPPLKSSFEILLEGPEWVDRGVALYRERFSEIGLFENRVYDGIRPLLAQLRSAGATLYVATSKPYVFASRIVEYFGLAQYFDQLFGSELNGKRTDKAELLRYAITETGVDASESTMVGDRSHDMVGAVDNDIRGVGVLYGYGSAEELTAAGASVIVEQIGDLFEVLSVR